MSGRILGLIVLAAWCVISSPVRIQTNGALAGEPDPDQPDTLTPVADRPGLPQVPVAFESEIIRIFIEPDSLRIEGIYRLRGAGDREQVALLNYPYPDDDRLGGARTELLEARTSETWVPLTFTEKPDGSGARWWVPVSPGRPVEVRTVYRQQRSERYARYIVTTTRAWDRPLQNARFEIYLPTGAQPDRFSHPFVPGQGAHGLCWELEVEDFWPDRDITVTWTAQVSQEK